MENEINLKIELVDAKIGMVSAQMQTLQWQMASLQAEKKHLIESLPKEDVIDSSEMTFSEA